MNDTWLDKSAHHSKSHNGQDGQVKKERVSPMQKELKNNKFHCPTNYTVKNCEFGEKEELVF